MPIARRLVNSGPCRAPSPQRFWDYTAGRLILRTILISLNIVRQTTATMTKNRDYDDAKAVTEYVWRWCLEHSTHAARVLAHAVGPTRHEMWRRRFKGPEGPNVDADDTIRQAFEHAWERLDKEAAEHEQWAEPGVYRQLERKRPHGLPSPDELRRRRSELQELEDLRAEPLRFRAQVAQRMIERGRITVARCPRCTCVLASPRAQQCRWCNADWHQTVGDSTAAAIDTMNTEDNGMRQELRGWLDLPYRRDEDFLMVVHEADLPHTCIRMLAEITGNVCAKDCEDFDGDYQRWASSIQTELSAAPSGVLFLINLNYQPEDVQHSLRGSWLRSMRPSTEQRLAFSFTPVNQTTAHLQRFNVAAPILDRRALCLTRG